MFFRDEKIDFFKPLTSKYREQVVLCLALLYQRQYGASADYGHALNREQILETLEESLIASRNQVFDSPDQNENRQRFKNTREHALWVLKQLLEFGWVERQVDEATLQSTYPFSRMGRTFSQALLESDNTQIRTRHRNTRNTLNALEAFHARGEIYDLLDAYEYSERIITDFTDVIAELEERKRELVKQVESEQLVHQATDQFFDFMEKRFQPDIAVRLSADSVEKHRDDISKSLAKIRRKSKEFKHKAEIRLRESVPGLCEDEHSYLWTILNKIEQRMTRASDTMLPALRRALHGFTKRADIIIRQLSYLNSQSDDSTLEICRELADLSDDEYNGRLNAAADTMATLQIRLVDPSSIKLFERKRKEQVDSIIKTSQSVDKEAQKEMMIQQILEQAFSLNQNSVKEYIGKNLRQGKKIVTSQLPIESADDLLAKSHAIEIAAINSLSSTWKFRVEPLNSVVKDSEYYHAYDEFSIELLESEQS